MIVFFDRGADERTELLPGYKENRKETPKDLEVQIPIIKEITALMGLQIIEKDGVEADDLIGAYASRYATEESPVLIVSADKDLAQCLSEHVSQLLPAPTANPRIGWRILKKEGVPEKFGVPSEKIAEYLALVGDTSDNIPGLPGVGPKTASKWLNEYGSLETIIEKANYIQPARFQTPIAQNAALLRLNLRLTTLDLSHEVPQETSSAVNPEALRDRLLELEMVKTADEVGKRFA